MGYTPPQLEVRKVTGGWSMYPPTNTTLDDLTIYANLTDATPNLKLLGTEGISFYLPADKTLRVYENGVDGLQMSYKASSNYAYIYCPVANKDLLLGTTGSGNIMFGTYTGGAATDSTGYITIKDAAGNTRKLMVQA